MQIQPPWYYKVAALLVFIRRWLFSSCYFQKPVNLYPEPWRGKPKCCNPVPKTQRLANGAHMVFAFQPSINCPLAGGEVPPNFPPFPPTSAPLTCPPPQKNNPRHPLPRHPLPPPPISVALVIIGGSRWTSLSRTINRWEPEFVVDTRTIKEQGIGRQGLLWAGQIRWREERAGRGSVWTGPG